MNIIKAVILVTALALPPVTLAAESEKPQQPAPKKTKSKNSMFKCEKDGVVTFSQLSCGAGANVVTVKMSQGQPTTEDIDRNLKSQQDVKSYVEAQDKSRGIGRHEAIIARYKEQMAKEFTQLQQSRFHTIKEKDDAIEALSKKYNALIEKQHEAIKALHEQGKKTIGRRGVPAANLVADQTFLNSFAI
jgi:hypothetical protein